MKKTPRISVIMSVFKEPIEWLVQSIQSILNQSFTDFEFIIINDNPSREENKRFLEEYSKKDTRIIIIENTVNIGLTKSLNKGLSLAKGKYIARMDADDISMPRRLEFQYKYMEEHSDVIVLGTNIEYIGHKSLWKRNDSIKFDDASIKAQMLMVNCIAHSSVLLRRSVLKDNVITYDENYRQSQDYRLWELLRPYGKFAVLPNKLVKYRISNQQITKSQTKGQANLAGNVRLRLQKNWLNEIGFKYIDEELEHNPLEIINRLRFNKEINNSMEYKAFLQYAYLLSGDKSWSLITFLKYDIMRMPILNVLRFLLNNL